MGRLAKFEHHVVGHIDQKVEGPLSKGVQASLHDDRRRDRGLAFEFNASVAGAVLEVVYRRGVLWQIVVGG
jgi:hypothetical protein